MKPLACMEMLTNAAEVALRKCRTPLTLIMPVEAVTQHAMMTLVMLDALLEC